MFQTLSRHRLLVVLCAIWVVLNFNGLFGGRVLPWDAIDQFYPTAYFNAHSLRTGQWPWWNPYIYSGYAQIGDPQGMLFSPLLMAWMLLRESPGAVWFGWGVLLHVLLGGAAMTGLMRRHGANALGCLIGATVFMAGGVAASRLQHVPIVVAYGYVPVVLLAIRHLLAGPTLGRGVLLGLAAGALVTQLVQVTYLFVLMIGAYALVAIVRHWPGYDATRRRAACMALAVAAAVAVVIGLPQLIFSWAAMSLSNRNELPLSLAADGSLDLRAFRFLVAPNAFDALRDVAHAPLEISQSFLYIGALPLLALYAVRRACADATQRRALMFFALVGAVACMYMLGLNTPFYGWLYTWLPGLTRFRRPADAAYLFNFALAVVSGLAASRIDLRSRRELTGVLVIVTGWLAVSALSMHRASAFAGVVAAALALWRLRRTGSDWRTVVWLMVVLVADYRGFNFNGTFNADTDLAARFRRSPAVRFLSGELAATDAGVPWRIATANTYTTWDNTVMVAGLPSTEGYNPLRYALYQSWYEPHESSNTPAPPAAYNARPGTRLDDLLGVRFLVAGHRDDRGPYTPPPRYRLVQSTRDVDIWRNDSAYPRFLNPSRTRALGVGELPDVVAFQATDFATTLWLTPRDQDDLVAGRTAADACTGQVQVDIRSATHTRTELHTRSSAPGWVVAGELDHPGWVAQVDDTPLPIHRANGMFRAVCVPAGEHRLSFAFHPWHMVAYAWQHRQP